MRSRIEIYENEFNLDLGSEGKHAINILYEEAIKSGIIPSIPDDIFVS